MTTLQTLADNREEILKAELAALLHNLGKLSSKFIKSKSKGQNYSFSFEYIAKPNKVINLIIHQNDFQTSDIYSFITKLLNDSSWHGKPTIATEMLGDNFFSNPSNFPTNPKTISRNLKNITTSSQTDANVIVNFINGAIALNAVLNDTKDSISTELEESQENFLLDVYINLENERHSIAALVLFMWDALRMNIKDGNSNCREEALSVWIGQTTYLQRYIMTVHGEISGAEKSAKNDDAQNLGLTWRSTTFGERTATQDAFQPTDLDNVRNEFLTKTQDFYRDVMSLNKNSGTYLPELFKLSQVFKKNTKSLLTRALGETRRPDNDVTLWDYVFSIASLYKASLAQRTLENQWKNTDLLRWRLLHISFDGLNFWSHARHITDMLGRREALTQGLDAVKQLLEVQYPIGNEIYRDENGSVFIVADKADLLELTDNNQKTLQELIKTAFDSESIYHELEPEIKLSDAYQGKQIKLANVLTNRFLSKLPRASEISKLWTTGLQEELCPVCEVRPMGSDGQVGSKLDSRANYEKAKARKICRVCLDRRGRRAKTWITDNAEKTVWIQEAADINGRFALIVGRFGLDGWLNGSFIPTTSKSASFARIQRCWETTKNFWEEFQNQCIPSELQLKKQLRLAIKTSGFDFIGNPYAYELEIAGQRLGVCWDETKKCLWTITNLKYFAQQLNLKFSDEESLEKVLSNTLKGQTLVKVFESNDSSKKDKEVGTLTIENIVKNEYFTPYIPLVTEPNLFMAIVPAQDVLTVTQAIKKKYETEMGRVRDRLPMHLGVVFANRRLPMQAVLEAGRNMLKMPDKCEQWTVKSALSYLLKIEKDETELEWQYPENMGDGATPDTWYPHLFITNPENRDNFVKGTDFKHVKELKENEENNKVYVFPSHFDFEFLDTTVRRFEVIYDENGRRRDKPTRPFLLDDLERFEKIWAEMNKLSASQRMQIITTIESTRELWKSSESDSEKEEVFKQFVKDTLNNAAWKTGEKPQEREFNLLLKAAISGELLDLFELHHEILKEG